jgi:hypothetical protein
MKKGQLKKLAKSQSVMKWHFDLRRKGGGYQGTMKYVHQCETTVCGLTTAQNKINKCNNPLNKYCLNILKKPQICIALTVLNDVLGELISVFRNFRRSCLAAIEAMQFAEVKINSLSTHYFGELIYQSNEVKNIFLAVDSDVDTTAILRFIELLCEHLDIRFSEEESMEWHTFDQTVIVKTTSVEQLIVKSSDLVLNYEENVATEICEQFCDLKFVAAEKFKTGFISDIQ